MQVSAMTIYVKFLTTGESIALYVHPEDPVEDVKNMIMEQEGIPVNVQRLIFVGKDLVNERTLEECHVGENATINLLINQTALKNCPLTFVAKEAGAEVSYTIQSGEALPPIEYSTDGSTWTTYTDAITLTNVGDKVSFRGNNATYKSTYKNAYFSCSDSCYIYGNIMSLVNATEYATATTLTENYVFQQLFEYNTFIKNHPHLDVLLPATTMTQLCYRAMFYGCTGLTRVPALPATTLARECYASMFNTCTGLTSVPEDLLPVTTLADFCYNSMFSSCSNLKNVPALPATTLANSCYGNMFYGCTGLTSVPENLLPATILTDFCYQHMFRGCTALTNAPALPATTLAKYCYNYMFYDCTALTNAPALPATTLAERCYNQMFYNCTGLTSAPVLPATTLPQYCYYYMFYGCSHLSSVTCMATSRENTNATTKWLYNVASNGIVYAPFGSPFEGQTSSTYNIPSGWTLGVALKANQDPQQTDVHYSTLYHSTQRYELPNDGTEAYVATLSGDALNLTKIAEGNQVLPENTAVILTSPSNIITLKPTDAEAVTFSVTNDLQGVDAATSAPGNCYVLSGHSSDNSIQEVGFYQFSGTLGAHKAYIVLPGASGAPKRLRFVFENTQDIEGVQSTEYRVQKILRDGHIYILRNGVEYNVNGQMVK